VRIVLRPHRTHCRRRRAAGRKDEGVIIILVAIFLLFVVGAMAALSIDVTTFYTARSEAQILADSAALTAARVLANSGMTSSIDSTLATNAQNLATNVATQVAQQNRIGGAAATTVSVTFPPCGQTPSQNNPCVRVTVTRTDLPTFFARIWGTTQVTVSASATAEAYNPSNDTNPGTAPVAPMCVKPWVLPNMEPTTTNPLFDKNTGAIKNHGLVGWTDAAPTPIFRSRCNNVFCGALRTPSSWRYYAGAPDSFPSPTQSLPSCSFSPTPYQLSVAGCSPTPIACRSQVNLDASNYPRNVESGDAVNCLIHAAPGAVGDGDSISVNPLTSASQPFQFLAGANNPIPGLVGNNIAVSDSLVTVPVYDNDANAPIGGPVTIIGFVQLFLMPDGSGVLTGPPSGRIATTIVNMVGCSNSVTGAPVIGNGPSTVAVRLVATPQQ
jgi:hypothetical protein